MFVISYHQKTLFSFFMVINYCLCYPCCICQFFATSTILIYSSLSRLIGFVLLFILFRSWIHVELLYLLPLFIELQFLLTYVRVSLYFLTNFAGFYVSQLFAYFSIIQFIKAFTFCAYCQVYFHHVAIYIKCFPNNYYTLFYIIFVICFVFSQISSWTFSRSSFLFS